MRCHWIQVLYSSCARTDGILNDDRYISFVLKFVATLFIRVLRDTEFHQNNTRMHVVNVFGTIFDAENVWLLLTLHISTIS